MKKTLKENKLLNIFSDELYEVVQCNCDKYKSYWKKEVHAIPNLHREGFKHYVELRGTTPKCSTSEDTPLNGNSRRRSTYPNYGNIFCTLPWQVGKNGRRTSCVVNKRDLPCRLSSGVVWPGTTMELKPEESKVLTFFM